VRTTVDRLLLALGALACVAFVPKVLWPGAAIYASILTGGVLNAFGSIAKLCGLLAGAFYGARAGLQLERGNPARTAWLLLAGWLGCFFAGQIVLSYYTIVVQASAPLPSAGDGFFLLGYALAIAAVVLFVRAYVRSGLPVGRLRGHAGIAVGAALVFAIAGYNLLVPIARADAPLPERIINVGYPVLDFVTLIPTLILIRITSRFRGGRLWTVWGTILVSLVCMSAGDILFAWFASIGVKALEPLVDLMFLVGYVCAGRGTILQLRTSTAA
jgi:hypothetical protein